MGRNRRQQRLRDRRSRPTEGGAPSTPARGSGGGSLSRPQKPAWRETLDSWGGFTVVGAIAIAIVIAALLVFMNRPGSSANDAAYEPRDQGGAPQDGVVLGDPNAPVRLIGYADFQCPHCLDFWRDVEPALIEEYVATGQVVYEFRNYAFLGSESRRAAQAAACAADQDRFWDFHDLLFLRQGTGNTGVYSDSNLKRYANTIGEHFDDFDVDAWESCFDAGTYEAAVQQENAQATNQGVRSTPTVLINGVAIEGTQPVDVYRQAIDAALRNTGN